MRRRLVLLATDLAVCIKRNVYQSYGDAVSKYMKSFDEEAYKELVKSRILEEISDDVYEKYNACIKDDTYVEKLMSSIDFDDCTIDIYVRGKCDVVEDASGNKSVLMLRNRKNRLFRRVPEYEHAQIMAYMFLYDVYRGSIVETYQGETHESLVSFDSLEFHMITLLAHKFMYSIHGGIPVKR